MSIAQECPSGVVLAASLKNVTKTYPHFKLQGINFDLAQGSVAGLIGPNGAGKSTTMRLLMGLITPESGSVTIFGLPLATNEAKIKQDVGFFSDDMRLYKPESLAWHMQFVRSLFPTWDDQYAQQLLERFGLIEQQAVKGLSHGQRVKAMLLLILARRPKLLILDEPTNGLDPVAKHEILTELMRVVEDDQRTILYSSHNTQDVEQISDSITFIDRGQVVVSHDRDLFLELWRRIKLHGPDNWKMPPVHGLRIESTFRGLRVLSHNQFDDSVVSQLTASGGTIESIEPMTLEEIFVSAVQRGREGSAI